MKHYDAEIQEKIKARARALPDVLGKPHLHSGMSLRPLGRYIEFRVGLDLRCLFLVEGGDIHLITAGTHDEIAAYVRNNG
jgi:hypothetical protein